MKNQNLKWEIKVPIFKNILILKQLGSAIGIPFSILIGFLLWHLDETGAKYALFLIFILFLMTFLMVLAIYQGKYHMIIHLDEKGITVEYPPSIQKKNKIINGLLILLGLFMKKPGAIGSGILANSKQKVKVSWNHLRKVKYYPKHQTIYIKGNIGQVLGIFCTKENYPLVVSIIEGQKNA